LSHRGTNILANPLIRALVKKYGLINPTLDKAKCSRPNFTNLQAPKYFVTESFSLKAPILEKENMISCYLNCSEKLNLNGKDSWSGTKQIKR